jgi:hypothetical protein
LIETKYFHTRADHDLGMRPDLTGNNSTETIPSGSELIEVAGQEREESLAITLQSGVREEATLHWLESDVFMRCNMIKTISWIINTPIK